ncbi:DNA mismatch repair protein MutS [Parabacteroides sp. PF5-9]|uniref:MutS family DNA mismatch repair protein n=1 Tax=Parabacteroides sp. PF5-9 TaxID=1742404 RepID=UPI00247686CA|nr:DNA mismatch repair protein MutS [Parabacteroides sp. PF5-9]MDH6358220.1 hypothetical protein [Parabacteroides sp. PF5-9]
MEKVRGYYLQQVQEYTIQLNGLKRRIHLLGSVRLVLVLLALISVWFVRNADWQLITGVLILYLIPFVVFMIYHNKLAVKKEYVNALIRLNENELSGLDYDFSAFDGAPEKSSSAHSYSLDLDLFGDHSLFQSVNRTVTPLGRELLVEWFLSPLTNKKEILRRQQAIRELSTSYIHLRQDFYVQGCSQQSRKNDADVLYTLSAGKFQFINSTLWKILTWIIPIGWTLVILGMIVGIVPEGLFGLYFLISFLIAYLPAKKVTVLYNSVDKMHKIFSVYSDLMVRIEGDFFQAEELAEISRRLTGKNNHTASQAIKKLSQYIGGLDQRFSAMGLILNILYMRDTRHAMCLERWKEAYASEIEGWFNALAHFDALSSLAGFAFNHPDAVFPEITDSYFKMEGKALGHPLLDRKACVKNDIQIHKSPWFLIITGANMAGKSTYLRTVGVNFLLACMGAPVCAESLTVYPAHLVTSLRTSDSLASNESYFFAELKRLKMIIDRLKAGEELFIILDEILKGTNSIDKQKGSIALMKQLVAYKTCGIIATHDLVLGTLEEEFPEQIKNYRFEADITNDELSFSYLLREGVAQNMNAYFLMKKMGITV